ncbi:hypothetical protein NE237_019301 [Protea cynaroides]|uniref:Uncharacterized protein n=1 Tax=Protea cynaroides TaxID=273540 RepID=A0A9Q0QPT3_9MAGN|nr:hypothetical protein NE237_019301 [Protea cynaroides]
MTLEFYNSENKIQLIGESSAIPTQLYFQGVRRLVTSDSVVELFSLEFLSITETEPKEYNADLQKLLDSYSSVFEKPTGLPPIRIHDHAIYLNIGAQPINVCPYRYPHFQKSKIERLVIEMLQDGVIRPSISPFSSPALLVRKKGRTWRFCFD